MPIYEYRCSQCGNAFEMIQGFSDKPLKKCKKCGGGLHKLVSECSFHLKGTGWYLTDYGKPGKSSLESTKKTKDKKDKPKAQEKSKAASNSSSSTSTSPESKT